MVVCGNRTWICVLSDFYFGVLEVSIACVSVKTNVGSSNANEGVKRTKVKGVWFVKSCGLIVTHRRFGSLFRVFSARK
jgi:hypothetical protein